MKEKVDLFTFNLRPSPKESRKDVSVALCCITQNSTENIQNYKFCTVKPESQAKGDLDLR